MRTPCYDCKKRKLNCHSNCSEYQDFDSKRKEQLLSDQNISQLHAFMSNRSKRFREINKKKTTI